MLKSIAKFILNTGAGRLIIGELIKLFKAWILKKYHEKHPHESHSPIIYKLEEILIEADVDDFIKEKDSAEFRFKSSAFLSKVDAYEGAKKENLA